jgi:hypothetical protein
MSTEVYGVWNDEMQDYNFTALGGTQGVLAAFASIKVPDGLWAIFGNVDLNNDSGTNQLLDVRLKAAVGQDRRLVKLGANTELDLASVSLMLLEAFPGTDTGRVNRISIGIWNNYTSTSQVPAIKVGRIKIIAMRVNSFLNEPA